MDFINGNLSKTEDSIRKSKYIAKLALQYSQILTRLGKSKKALKFAYSAYNHSSKALLETLKSCKKQQISLTQKKSHKKHSKSENYRLVLIKRALPTLEALKIYLLKGLLHKVEMRSAIGIKGNPDWVSNINIDEIVTITPTRSTEFTSGMGIQAEYTKDYLFFKIALLSISLYFLGTRHCMLNSEKGFKYCTSAFQLLGNFFTDDCPIVQELNEKIEKISKERIKSPEKIRRNKSQCYNISKFSVHSTSYSKFKSICERPNSGGSSRGSPNKKKVRRNVSHPASFFKDMKKRVASSELKLNVE